MFVRAVALGATWRAVAAGCGAADDTTPARTPCRGSRPWQWSRDRGTCVPSSRRVKTDHGVGVTQVHVYGCGAFFRVGNEPGLLHVKATTHEAAASGGSRAYVGHLAATWGCIEGMTQEEYAAYMTEATSGGPRCLRSIPIGRDQ